MFALKNQMFNVRVVTFGQEGAQFLDAIVNVESASSFDYLVKNKKINKNHINDDVNWTSIK